MNQAQVSFTDIPGLFDVITPSGRECRDLTANQVRYLAESEGWQAQLRGTPFYPITFNTPGYECALMMSPRSVIKYSEIGNPLLDSRP